MTGTQDGASGSVEWRHVLVLAAALLLPMALYAIGVLLPFYANDLHHLPLADVASGAHDPKDLWPQNAWVHLAGVFGLLLLPFVAFAGIGLGATSLAVLWRRPGSQRPATSLVLLVITAASTAALLFPLSELGAALMVWRLD